MMATVKKKNSDTDADDADGDSDGVDDDSAGRDNAETQLARAHDLVDDDSNDNVKNSKVARELKRLHTYCNTA